MNIEHLIPDLAKLLGLDPSTVLFLLGVIVSVSNLLGRVIPDDAVGPLGVVRKVAKIIGLYVPNTIAAGVTVNQVCRDSLAHELEEIGVPEHPLPPPVVKAFPGLSRVDDIIESTATRLNRMN